MPSPPTPSPVISGGGPGGGQPQPTLDTPTVVELFLRSTGDDTTGDGSLATPWYSLERAFRFIADENVGGFLGAKHYVINVTGAGEIGISAGTANGTLRLPPFFSSREADQTRSGFGLSTDPQGFDAVAPITIYAEYGAPATLGDPVVLAANVVSDVVDTGWHTVTVDSNLYAGVNVRGMVFWDPVTGGGGIIHDQTDSTIIFLPSMGSGFVSPTSNGYTIYACSAKLTTGAELFFNAASTASLAFRGIDTTNLNYNFKMLRLAGRSVSFYGCHVGWLHLERVGSLYAKGSSFRYHATQSNSFLLNQAPMLLFEQCSVWNFRPQLDDRYARIDDFSEMAAVRIGFRDSFLEGDNDGGFIVCPITLPEYLTLTVKYFMANCPLKDTYVRQIGGNGIIENCKFFGSSKITVVDRGLINISGLSGTTSESYVLYIQTGSYGGVLGTTATGAGGNTYKVGTLATVANWTPAVVRDNGVSGDDSYLSVSA